MLEKDIERKACTWAKQAGWLTYKFTSPSKRSVPDRIFVKAGRVVFIEFKTEAGKTTVNQRREIARLLEAGAEVHICHSVTEAQLALEQIAGSKVRVSGVPYAVDLKDVLR